MIIPIWQPLGYSTNLIAQNVAKKLNAKCSHTTRRSSDLEGVIIVLTEEDRTKKYELAKWHKTYEFKIVTGFKTDTLDLMGRITEQNFKNQKAITECKNLIGNYIQKAPIYSAVKYKSKPLFWHARNKTKIPSNLWPTKQGKIIDLQLIKNETLEMAKVCEYAVTTINKISGDFRQQQIIKQYIELSNSKYDINITTFRVKTTKGLYVRQIAQDILKANNLTGTTYSITRIQNGSYTRHNTKTLKEIFNQSNENYDFESNHKIS
jgi:tRNA pseudouridine(55) synthase